MDTYHGYWCGGIEKISDIGKDRNYSERLIRRNIEDIHDYNTAMCFLKRDSCEGTSCPYCLFDSNQDTREDLKQFLIELLERERS